MKKVTKAFAVVTLAFSMFAGSAAMPVTVPSVAAAEQTATISYGTNFRTAPSLSTSKVLFLVPTGATVTVLQEYNSYWTKVRYVKNGTSYTGYVDARRVQYNSTPTTTPSTTTQATWEKKADAIIALGLKYRGTPYEFGADLGQTRTFDCSSFANYLYERQGIDLPRDSRQQSTEGTYVSTSNLRKGDLMFFTISSRQYRSGVERVGHVGIYMGDGKILHTYKVGVGVTVSNFSGYWKDMYLFSRRVL